MCDRNIPSTPMIPINKFTTKSQEALQRTHRFVFEQRHTEMKPDHLLLILVEQEDGVVLSILNKLNADTENIKTKLREAIKQLAVSNTEIDINKINIIGNIDPARNMIIEEFRKLYPNTIRKER